MKLWHSFYNSKDHSTIQTERSEQLGTLFRENIYTLIEEDTIPVIPSSLVAYYPNNTEPPIESLIKRYQHTHQFKTFEKRLMHGFKIMRLNY